MWIRALVGWCMLLLAAVGNGVLRESLLVARFGPSWAHAISSFTLSAAILGITWLAIGWIAPTSAGDAWRVGVGWLLLTLAFEFGFGRARGTSWATLLADYNLWRGRLWLLVLATTLAAPWIAGQWRNLWPEAGP